jgi:hypothetical protein
MYIYIYIYICTTSDKKVRELIAVCVHRGEFAQFLVRRCICFYAQLLPKFIHRQFRLSMLIILFTTSPGIHLSHTQCNLWVILWYIYLGIQLPVFQNRPVSSFMPKYPRNPQLNSRYSKCNAQLLLEFHVSLIKTISIYNFIPSFWNPCTRN